MLKSGTGITKDKVLFKKRKVNKVFFYVFLFLIFNTLTWVKCVGLKPLRYYKLVYPACLINASHEN